MIARVQSATGVARNAYRYVCAGVGALSVLGLVAQVTPAHAVAEGEIVLGDITVMRIRTAAGNVTAAQRASMVQERINEVLAIPGLKANDVHIVKTPYGPTLYVRKIKLITVDADTAKDQSMSQDDLAKTWAHRLMGIIAQVDIRVVPTAPATPPATPGVPADPNAPAAPGTPTTPGTPAPATPAQGAPTTPANPPTTPPATPATPDPAKPAPATPATPAPTTPAPATPATPAAPATPPATPPANPAPATPKPQPTTPGETSPSL